jgi:hypothetical protein
MFVAKGKLSELTLPFSKFYRCLSFPEILRFQEPDITNNSPWCHKTNQVHCKRLPGKHFKWSNTWKEQRYKCEESKFMMFWIPYFLLFQKASTNILLYLIAIGHTAEPSSKAPWKIQTKEQLNFMFSMHQQTKMFKYMTCNTWLIFRSSFNHLVYRVKRKVCSLIFFFSEQSDKPS